MTVTVSSDIKARTRRSMRQLRELAVRALERMFRPSQGFFAFRLRRMGESVRLEGTSRRYTAIALIGLADERQATAERVLGGQSPRDVCGRLLSDLEIMEDLGEVALTLWAARAVGHPKAEKPLKRLRAMRPDRESFPTVEVAWCLSGLSIQADSPTDPELAGAVAERLLKSFESESGMFPHWPVGVKRPWTRAHVTCFADLVYPIQGLSRYHLTFGSDDSIDVASRCADRICQLQGEHGQWWWHYDVRTGRVIERYPVYTVHQDSMGPMALTTVEQACGRDYGEAIDRSLAWLDHSPEIDGSLIDEQADVIWRKVARHEPDKLVRKLQAAISRLHPAMRAPGTGFVFRPSRVDYESRPYHMGWILHAWPARRIADRRSGDM